MSADADRIELEHGGGGRLTRDFIDAEIVSRFGDGALAGLPDAALLARPETPIVFTTDSFVVQPLEFPGGNIGDLAVHGTVNDLAVSGGRPRWLSLALVIEEGLRLEVLRRVLDAVKRAADACGVTVVTGDTKVVARGQCDGLYVNTAGIGELMTGFRLGPERVSAGDHVLVSGPIAEHGFAVMACRENIHIENAPRSDTAAVYGLVEALDAIAGGIHRMRDPTRGGLAAVLNEFVEGRRFGITLQEESIPLSAGGRAVAELLGLDPLHVASEGRLLLVCEEDLSDAILERWRALPEGSGAARIGSVDDHAGRVIMQTVTGGRRLVDVPRGELLPRIC